MVCVYYWKGGKIQAPACSVSGKGPSLRLDDFSSVLTKPAQFMQSARPITSPVSETRVIYTINRNKN